MSFLKALGWVAGGVAAVIAAPVTGGGSLAVLIGAAGTTTAAGAVIGGLGGLAVSKVADVLTDDSEERVSAAEKKAEQANAKAAVAERKRQEENSVHTAQLAKLKDAMEAFLSRHAAELESLRGKKFEVAEIRLLAKAAALVAAADGKISKEEHACALEGVSVLCADVQQAEKLVNMYMAAPPSVAAFSKAVNKVDDPIQLKRLLFVLEAVALANDDISVSEQAVIDILSNRLTDIEVSA